MSIADSLFAFCLRGEWDEIGEVAFTMAETNKRKRDEVDLNATRNMVDPRWEKIDPTPDIHSLFGVFDIKFFRGKLQCVELEWSKRMYRCAGICYQRTNARGMSITIRLSEPLLKLRSRRNLIETLLHEMIHAYLFVQNVREPNGGHGPNFKKMMTDINRVAGTNITVYHTFHEEVAVYQTHIWRCNGICQHRKPFYGWVKRTKNLAPNPRDFWWAKHHESCGGTFQKVSEPEPKGRTKKAKTKHVESTPKITNFWSLSSGTLGVPGGYTKWNGGRTAVSKPTTQNRTETITSNGTSGSQTNEDNIFELFGQDQTLDFSGIYEEANQKAQQDKVRSVWSDKYIKPTPNEEVSGPSTSTSATSTSATELKTEWEAIDDDIFIQLVENPVIEIEDDSVDCVDVKPEFEEGDHNLHKSIKQELLDDLGEDGEGIELIDDEFNDGFLDESLEILTDAKVIDELFGIDDLMANFNEANGEIMTSPENKGNPNREIISCPICQDDLARENLSEHLDGCTGITIKINPKGNKRQPLPFYKNQAEKSRKMREDHEMSNKKGVLREAGYDEETINRLFPGTQEATDYNERITREMSQDERKPAIVPAYEPVAIDAMGEIAGMRDQHACPVCNTPIFADEINQHLDICLQDETGLVFEA